MLKRVGLMMLILATGLPVGSASGIALFRGYHGIKPTRQQFASERKLNPQTIKGQLRIGRESFDVPITSLGDGTSGVRRFVVQTAEGSMNVNASVTAAGTLTYGLGIIDVGAPSLFGFSFTVPIVSVGSPNTVRASLSGGFTDFAGDGVSITPFDTAVQMTHVAAGTIDAGVGVGNAVTIPAGLPGQAYTYGSFSAGPQAGPGPGPWTDLSINTFFTLSGGSDGVALAGSARIEDAAPAPPAAADLILRERPKAIEAGVLDGGYGLRPVKPVAQPEGSRIGTLCRVRIDSDWFDVPLIRRRDGSIGLLNPGVESPGGAVSFSVHIAPSGAISYALGIIDFGAPSVFGFLFGTPITPVGGANSVYASMAGGLLDFTGNGVTISPAATYIQTGEVGAPPTDMDVGLADVPVTGTGLPGEAYTFGPFSAGPKAGPGPGPWTTLSVFAFFGLTGDGDVTALTGAVRIETNNPPVASCQNVTVAAGPSCTAAASIDDGSSDPDGDTLTLTQAPPGAYPVGTTTVTLTASDGKGGSSQCTGTVTVVDNTPPTINCPANIVTTVPTPDICSKVVTYSAPTVSDNCPGIGGPTCSPVSGSSFAVGTTTVTCTVTDGSANTSTCTFTVQVQQRFVLADDGNGNCVVVTRNSCASSAASYCWKRANNTTVSGTCLVTIQGGTTINIQPAPADPNALQGGVSYGDTQR